MGLLLEECTRIALGKNKRRDTCVGARKRNRKGCERLSAGAIFQSTYYGYFLKYKIFYPPYFESYVLARIFTKSMKYTIY